jgi:signal transduction histidine kinase
MSDAAAMRSAFQSLAAYLSQRREHILSAWHQALDADMQVTAHSNLSRAQFNDHIPAVLEGFERRLGAAGADDEEQVRARENANAAEHGLLRWQQGYDQRETMREWGHLQLCLLREMEQYAAAQPQVDPQVMAMARRALACLCSDGLIESAARYQRLQQAEATARLRDLEHAFNELQLLERERAEGWRQAAHDLRGSVGIISNASAVLNRDLPEPQRAQFSRILQRGVSSLHTLLSDLIDVARLEAGHERRRISEFDAAHTLRTLCETMRNAAGERSLFLLAQGPDSLLVAGDQAKVIRIAQNLLLNAFKATQQGGVRVLWEVREQQWMMCVQDTGPGFTRGSGAALEQALKLATEESHAVDARAAAAGDAPAAPAPAATLPSQSGHASLRTLAGEGIGLSIVKRLCELLDATLELETSAGEGTTFRVSFPRAYADDVK